MVVLVLGLVFLTISAVCPAPTDAENYSGERRIWAVLVAGSKGYGNYRHQADLCHAYQILHRHGIPDSRIIVMMYDDIAYHEENPLPGIIINKPGGPNVYGPKEVPKDYTGDDVTPDNFVHILTGNSKAMVGVGSGKVLKSGPNDHVLINFVDHGGPGLIGFPNDVMAAHTLVAVLQKMNKMKMFKKLVFYLEACESGSMFYKTLPDNINVFATTAANPHESSFACYWDGSVQAYLGDEYSVSWMEDIDYEDHHNMTTETLGRQFMDVVRRVRDSRPSVYGQMSIRKNQVKEFLGASEKKVKRRSIVKPSLEPFYDSVPSRDVLLHTLKKKIQLANNAEDQTKLEKQLHELIKGRQEVDKLFSRILGRVTEAVDYVENKRPSITMEMMPCYKTLLKNFNKKCVNINKNTYTLAHMFKLANLCSASDDFSTEQVLLAFESECADHHRALSSVD